MRFAGKLSIATVTMALLMMFSAVAVFGFAKFFSTTSSVNSSGELVVTWDERGVGNGDIDYTLTADATSTWVCINGGGKNPSAANKRDFNGEVSTGGSFQARNGRVQGSLTTGPLGPGDFTCPGGQRLRLASVSYTNIVLTDTTNGSSTPVPDASRTFFAV